MAERRMFSKTIIDSDAFLDMPLSAQALYFHLSMRADNEGFVGNPKRIQKVIGASEDDMRILLMKRYILAFESGVVVIKHWYINNYIRGDRKGGTTYLEEKSLLMLDAKDSYTEADKCQTHGRQLADKCPPREEKSRVEEIRLEESNNNTHTHELDFLSNIPTLEEIKEYIILKDFKIDAEHFYNYYSAKGWKMGNTPIENWKSLVNDWARKDFIGDRVKTDFPQRSFAGTLETTDISDDEI